MGTPSLARFTIRRQLGEGGMGVVYEAFDEERRARVALKVLSRFDPGALARFKREFRALQGLAHPNLVALDELFFEDGQWFLTMELLDGIDFISHVRGSPSSVAYQSTVRENAQGALAIAGAQGGEPPAGALDEAKLRDAFRQLVEGLAALHAAGKVHRDVKPSNVLVDREERVVLLDFGLVTEAFGGDERFTGAAVVGTPVYMAPEQAASRDVGPAADLYAAGVMLYEALTGRLPIGGPRLQVLIDKQTKEPPPPESVASDVPADLAALSMRLLRIDPRARPTAAEVARTLTASRRPSRASSRPDVGRTSTEGLAFVGRAAELVELERAFERCRVDRSSTVLVCGESGIGKSYLVRRFTAQVLAEHPDAFLLEGRCYERESVPYKTLDGVVDALSARLSRLPASEAEVLLPSRAAVLGRVFPSFLRVPQVARARDTEQAVDPHEYRRRAFHALRELFARISTRRPTVITIDDLQWADEEGLRALAQILEPPDAPPLLFVGTVRTSAAGRDDVLARLAPVAREDAVVIDLPALGHDDARELAARVLRRIDVTQADPDVIAKEAGGHPLFVEELARHLSTRDSLPSSSAAAAPARAEVKLDDAIGRRVAQLDDPTREMAELACVAGRPLPQDVLAAAARVAPGELVRRSAELRAANLVRAASARGADAVEPYHDRVREAVLAAIDGARRCALHERLAVAFEGSPHRDPETLASHWRDAGDLPRAATHAIAAAEEASRIFGFERAAEWYLRALDWSASAPADRRALRVKVGEELAKAGRGVQAAPYFQAAAAESPPVQALDLRRRAAEELLAAGRFEDGDGALRDVLHAVGIGLPRAPAVALLGLLLFRLLLRLRGLKFRARTEEQVSLEEITRVEACNAVGRILAFIDPIRGGYFQTRALLAALALGEPGRIAYTLAVEAAYLATAGEASRSNRLLVQADAVAGDASNVQVRAIVDGTMGIARLLLGDFAEALRRIDHAAETLREGFRAAWWELRQAQLCAMWTLVWTGDLKELSARAERAVPEARDRGDVFAETTLQIGGWNLAWLRGGDATSARGVAERALERWTRKEYHAQHYWQVVALARIDLYEGGAEEALRRVEAEWPRVRRAMFLRIRLTGAEARHLRGGAALAVAAIKRGTERAELVRRAEREARALLGMRWPVATALARPLLAAAASLRGDPARARRELAAGVEAADVASMRLHAAAAKLHLGRLQGGDEGRLLEAAAQAWMKEQGVGNAAALARMIAPGFAAE